MKKSLLLLMAGITAATANAQQSTNMLFKNATGLRQVPEMAVKSFNSNTRPSHKTTAGSHTAWFSFDDANFNDGISSSSLMPIYNDSTLFVPGGTPTPFNWYIMGLGSSFDPTSTAFAPGSIVNSSYTPADFVISNTNAYTVDSFQILGRYERMSYNNYTDTLNIYLVPTSSTTGSGTYKLAYNKDVYFSTNLGITDSQLHEGNANYDSVNNKIATSATGVIRIQKILDAAAFADSTSTGFHSWSFALPSTLSVPAGQKLVMYQQYISGYTYPVNMSIDSANIWEVLTQESNGSGNFPHQNAGDYNNGLIITAKGRYNVDTQASYFSGAQIMGDTYLYGASAHFDDPYVAYHVTCASCLLLDVAQVAATNDVKVYPNPATKELNVSVTANTTATVTLTNALGQVVATRNNVNNKATFNTANLPSGMYIYTISANGNRTSGHVAIAH